MITSFIIPSRNEKSEYLYKTLDSICDNAKGEYEVIIGFDGPHSTFLYSRLSGKLKTIEFPSVMGIKSTLNALAACATGKYLFKLDAHCSVSPNILEILQADMQDDWVVMPRFYILNKDTWEWQDERFYDYFFIPCPLTDSRGYRFKAGGHWPERTQERLNLPIDETPQIHGSGWFTTKEHFFELGGFPLKDPYGHAQEPEWLALRTWLKGGRVIVNKNCWYAHLHQSTSDKGFALGHTNEEKTYNLVANYWMRNKEPDMIHNMAWFINEKFPNMPTWPSNWEELQKEYEINNP